MSTLTFFGGAHEVTGANILLDTGGMKMLVDCGLHQGEQFDVSERNRKPFSYDPSSVDVLCVTHAHADHIGRIPFLVSSGFTGKIYSTPQTKALAEIVLIDAVHIFEEQEKKLGTPVLYTEDDVAAALALWDTVSFHDLFHVGDMSLRFVPVGHILGAGVLECKRGEAKIVFTGDIGNAPDVLLPDPEQTTGATYLVTESVYGNRMHSDRSERKNKLRDAIIHADKRGGTLLIPSFAVHRTQTLLYEINNLFEHAQAPVIPVYLDSPLAIKATEIYRANKNLFNDLILSQIHRGDDIFSFPQLTFVHTAHDSSRLTEVHGPKVIIAGSGMSVGGRVIDHERRLLEDRNTTILFVGYQAPGTLGRKIQDGISRVKIGDTYIHVRAKVGVINGYSGHADKEQLFAYTKGNSAVLKRVFVTMGEASASRVLAERIQHDLSIAAVVPEEGSVHEIDF